MIRDKVWETIQRMFTPWFANMGNGHDAQTAVSPATAGAASDWQPGDWAIYRKSKRSTNPGRRAFGVKANPKGETYAYVVDKFWIVERVLPNGNLVMRTARGKTHQISGEDPNLSRPGWLARIRWGERFRGIEQRERRATLAA